jgi:hypothetical protein
VSKLVHAQVGSHVWDGDQRGRIAATGNKHRVKKVQ